MTSLKLSRKLALEEAIYTPDGAGGFSESWSELGVLWADVRAGTGREKAGANLTLATVPYRITVRGAPEGAPSRPKPDQRFREGDRIYRIIAVSDRYPDQRYLICFAKEEVAA